MYRKKFLKYNYYFFFLDKYIEMLNLKDGQPIAKIETGKFKDEIIYLKSDDIDPDDYSGCEKIDLKKNSLKPILNTDERQICYVAGPSGSGKTTYAVDLAKNYKKIFPKRDIYLFSRTDYKDDPAYVKLKPIQIELDDTLVTEPIDIETELKGGSLVIFDDCATINDKAVRSAINELITDIMEVGRKLNIWLILTNHLVNPNEKKFGRTVMNEMQTFTFFPKSGSAYQVKYCLKNYFGMSNKQIEEILGLPSRWVTILKGYPQCVMYQHGAYLL